MIIITFATGEELELPSASFKKSNLKGLKLHRADPQRSLQVFAPAAILGEGRWVVGSTVHPLVVEGEFADPPGKLQILWRDPRVARCWQPQVI